MVDDGELSRANGTINMMTNIAVIVGTLAAGWISERLTQILRREARVLKAASGEAGLGLMGRDVERKAARQSKPVQDVPES